MSNRLKGIRKHKGLTLSKVSEAVNIKPNTLSQYENEKREPKLETWEKLASFFKVPPSYLMGLTDDKIGWLDWSRNTGYSVPQLQDEVARLDKTGRLKGIDDIQEKIGLAVESLDAGAPTTTQGVTHELNYKLMELKQYVNNAFIDPETTYLNKEDNEIPFKPLNPHPKVRQDMDEKAYEEILDILDDARYKIAQIKIDKKYL